MPDVTGINTFHLLEISKKIQTVLFYQVPYCIKSTIFPTAVSLSCLTLFNTSRLVTSNFSFSHNVSHSYISLVHQTAALCGNGLNNPEEKAF